MNTYINKYEIYYYQKVILFFKVSGYIIHSLIDLKNNRSLMEDVHCLKRFKE